MGGSSDELKPTRSFFGGKKDAGPKLPANWKKAKDKEGNVYYFNSITQQKTHDFPPTLPKGWREALHKESGRVYYYHKETKQSTFEFPQGPSHDDSDDDDDDDGTFEPSPSFFGRTISKFRGKKDDGMGRTATMTKKKEKHHEEKKKDAGGAGGSADGAQKTVFISCSTLIKEVKLCVGKDLHPGLDSLYDRLTSHEIPAEQAVRLLMEMVGSTVVQQAGLSVMNAQKGVLPHGWLEYQDEASGRPYYYNVHTKVTTWYKPTGAVPPPPPTNNSEGEGEGGEGGEGGMMVNFECTLETHSVAMTGFI